VERRLEVSSNRRWRSKTRRRSGHMRLRATRWPYKTREEICFSGSSNENATKKRRRSTMVTRRRFLSAAAAGAAMFARIPNVLAATYDLVVKGGRVIDPSLGIDAVRDVAVAGGRIAAV